MKRDASPQKLILRTPATGQRQTPSLTPSTRRMSQSRDCAPTGMPHSYTTTDTPSPAPVPRDWRRLSNPNPSSRPHPPTGSLTPCQGVNADRPYHPAVPRSPNHPLPSLTDQQTAGGGLGSTQASSAIPVVPLYICALYRVMKAKGTHEARPSLWDEDGGRKGTPSTTPCSEPPSRARASPRHGGVGGGGSASQASPPATLESGSGFFSSSDPGGGGCPGPFWVRPKAGK